MDLFFNVFMFICKFELCCNFVKCMNFEMLKVVMANKRLHVLLNSTLICLVCNQAFCWEGGGFLNVKN
jgi:hypothetical protein